jgi:hypothetical protein
MFILALYWRISNESTNKLEPSRCMYHIAQAYYIHSFILFSGIYIVMVGAWGGVVVKALRY